MGCNTVKLGIKLLPDYLMAVVRRQAWRTGCSEGGFSTSCGTTPLLATVPAFEVHRVQLGSNSFINA